MFSPLLAICKITDDIQFELSSRDGCIEHLSQIFIDFFICQKQIGFPMWLINNKVKDYYVSLAALEAMDCTGSNEIEVLLESSVVVL